MILNKFFYSQPTLVVAQKLLGCFLCRQVGKKIIKGIIAETEAYCGPNDLASHASRGRTPRTEIMFGPAGYAYIYLVYGMYYCFNIVTEAADYPAAVLIRAVKVDNIDYGKTNGPGKLCKILKINKSLNGLDLTKKSQLWVEATRHPATKPSPIIIRTPRIGVPYAGPYKDKKWRFALKK